MLKTVVYYLKCCIAAERIDTMPEKKKSFDLSTTTLHILAMGFMLMDHMWATIALQHRWLTCAGRIAYPIFAFLLVEGFFHTRSLKQYMLRMLAFALVSEIPFDLLYSGMWFYPYHQNVLWTFLIGLGAMWMLERVGRKGLVWQIVLSGGTTLLAFLLGFALQTDFYGFGVLTILIFYFFRGRNWWCLLGQFAALYWLNVEVMGGMCYLVTIFGRQYELVEQGFALLALIPIWLYRGRKGKSSKPFQYFCYAFYPLHCLILGLLSRI